MRRRIITVMITMATATWIFHVYLSTKEWSRPKIADSLGYRYQYDFEEPQSLIDKDTQEERYIPREGDHRRKKILIVTYMRSGSTFLGSMFKAHTDVFYVFEPLWFMGDTYSYEYLNDTVGTAMDTEAAKVDALNNIFNCHFERLSLALLIGELWKESTEGEEFYSCGILARTRMERVRCVSMLVQPCQAKRATIVKTLRVRMSSVETMLQNDPDLKVINLVRDPRPTIGSQHTWGYTRGRGLGQYVKQHCDKVYNDVIITKRLAVKYPDRVRLVYYEDLTVNTEEETRQLYNLINLPFTDKVLSHIQQLATSRKCKGGHFLCLEGKNTTEQLSKWRRTMTYKSVRTIDRQCGHVYDVLGYLPVTSVEHFKDLSISLRQSEHKIKTRYNLPGSLPR